MSYIFNFVVEILLILTYDLRSVDQIKNDSPFYAMWVVGLEVQRTTSMSRLPIHFRGQFWTALQNENVLEVSILLKICPHRKFQNCVNWRQCFRFIDVRAAAMLCKRLTCSCN
jgi:hypothetical protein